MHTDSVASEKRAILVVQPGGELECALSRDWIAALQYRNRIETVGRLDYAEILDLAANPTCFHPLPHNPLDLLRTRRLLKSRSFDAVLCLANSWSGRFVASICPAPGQIRTQVGPPVQPSQIDAVLAVLFGHFGVDKPQRAGPLVLTRRTQATADKLLAGFGFDRNEAVPMIAPKPQTGNALASSWESARTLTGAQLPVVLLPAGHEIGLISTLVGKAYFVTSPRPELRAALIQRASLLLSNHRLSIELAQLMQTPVRALNGNSMPQ